jgi:hypothetical protein
VCGALCGSQHIKGFLKEVKTNLRNMVRTVNVRSEVLTNMDIISDLSYAWDIMNDFLPDMHARYVCMRRFALRVVAVARSVPSRRLVVSIRA